MELIRQLEATLAGISRIGAEARELRVDSPADESELIALENSLGMPLPCDFRRTLATCSAHLEFSWFLEGAVALPEQLAEIFRGDLHWDAERMPDIMAGYQQWILEVFPDPENPYDRVWHNKLPFQEVGNGDLLAIDLSNDAYGRIVYLSHEDGEGHGYVLAHNFGDLLERWIPLGCPGGEDWQWMPFVSSPTSGIDPECDNAKLWKSLVFRESASKRDAGDG